MNVIDEGDGTFRILLGGVLLGDVLDRADLIDLRARIDEALLEKFCPVADCPWVGPSDDRFVEHVFVAHLAMKMKEKKR